MLARRETDETYTPFLKYSNSGDVTRQWVGGPYKWKSQVGKKFFKYLLIEAIMPPSVFGAREQGQ